MKRSELNVGDELYWAKPGDWTHDYIGKKVTVLHVEPYGRSHYSHRGTLRAEHDGKGNGVHVQVHNPGFGSREDVVQLGHLRGPYAATLAEVEAQIDAKDKARREATAHRIDLAATRNAMTRRAHDAGYRFGGMYGPDAETMVATNVETLGAMLDRIEALTADVSRLEDEITDLRVELSGTEHQLDQERMGSPYGGLR